MYIDNLLCFKGITLFFDLQEFSIFLFDKRGCDRIHRLKKKDTLSDILRKGVKELARCRHPRFLQVG